MRRALCLATFCLVVLPASAQAADVRVFGISGEPKALSLDSLAGREDVRDRQYSVGGSTKTVDGFSLEMVIREAKADPYGWGYLEVVRPGGGTVVLSDEQVFDDAFPDGPPVVTDEGGAAGFLRPATGEQGDGGEEFAATPLDVHLREGSAIEVAASSSAAKAKAGEEVEFTANVEQSPAGERPIYSWTFGDGSRGTGQSVTHSFDEAGSYNVVVGVKTATQDVGGSDAVRVTVDRLAKGGPDREGGGRNRAADAPDSGAVDGGTGTGTGGYGNGAGGSGTGSGSGAGAAAGVPADAGSGESPPAPEEREAKTDVSAGERVVGELLSASAPATEAAEEGEAAGARTGTPVDEEGSGVPGVVIAFLVVGGLLGLGGLKEGELIRFERIREAVAR